MGHYLTILWVMEITAFEFRYSHQKVFFQYHYPGIPVLKLSSDFFAWQAVKLFCLEENSTTGSGFIKSHLFWLIPGSRHLKL